MVKRGRPKGYRASQHVVAAVNAGSGLNSLCWCERHYVRVSSEMIRAGLTHSCGHSDCHAPRA